MGVSSWEAFDVFTVRIVLRHRKLDVTQGNLCRDVQCLVVSTRYREPRKE